MVFDTTARTLWVSEGPHLLGRFLGLTLSPEVAPAENIPADPLLSSPEYRKLPKH